MVTRSTSARNESPMRWRKHRRDDRADIGEGHGVAAFERGGRFRRQRNVLARAQARAPGDVLLHKIGTARQRSGAWPR